MIPGLLPPAWVTVLQPPHDLLSALRQEGALLCASLCAKADRAILSSVWAEAAALGLELQEVSWEGLHSGAAWREVTLTMRRAYAYSQFILAAAEIVQIHQEQVVCSSTASPSSHLKESMRRLDMALLMGPPDIHGQANALIDWAQDQLLQHESQSPIHPSSSSSSFLTSKKRPRDQNTNKNNDNEGDIPRVTCPSLHAFLTNHMQPQVPVILTNCLEHWPALERWQDLNYLKRVAGQRVVPVEVGTGTYLTSETEEGEGGRKGEDEGGGEWGQQLMPLANFIEQYVVGAPADGCEEGEEGRETTSTSASSDATTIEVEADEGLERAKARKTSQSSAPKTKKGYLAQHELFEQIPALKKDIYTPDYCALEVEGEEGEDDEDGEEEGVLKHDDGRVILHAWFGPGGTVSPTHTDPYHNLLAQVVGCKVIRLFAPSESSFMYAHVGRMQNNSQVDPRKPDLVKFPLFAQARSQRCVLREGEMLYIPPVWWHHVEALKTSFSVSFWWGGGGGKLEGKMCE